MPSVLSKPCRYLLDPTQSFSPDGQLTHGELISHLCWAHSALGLALENYEILAASAHNEPPELHSYKHLAVSCGVLSCTLANLALEKHLTKDLPCTSNTAAQLDEAALRIHQTLQSRRNKILASKEYLTQKYGAREYNLVERFSRGAVSL